MTNFKDFTDKNAVIKTVLSFAAGILCLCLAGKGALVIDSSYDAYFYFGIALCLGAGMLWGTKYGVISSLGIFFPFALWKDYGYANLVTSAFLLIWLIGQCLCIDYTKKGRLPFYTLYIYQILFDALVIFAANPLMQLAVRFNPPFWTDNYTVSYLSNSIINVNKILLIGLTTITAFALHSLFSSGLLRRLFAGQKNERALYNDVIIVLMVVIIFIMLTTRADTQSSMFSVSFSVNSYKSDVGNFQFSMLKIIFVTFLGDFLIYFLEYRHEIQERERISYKKYLNIFSNILDVYLELTPELVIKSVSPSVTAVFSAKENALVGKNLAEFFADEADKTLFLQCLEGEKDSKDREFYLKLDNGRKICLLSSRIAYASDDTVIFIARDVTERNKAIEKSREMAELQKAIFESSDNLIFSLRDNKIVSCNKRAREFFAKRCENPVLFSDIWSENENVEWTYFIGEAMKHKNYVAEYFDESEARYYQLHFNVLDFSKNKRDISVFAKDITDEKTKNERTRIANDELEYRVLERTKELTKAYNELENFSAVVAHEFKSPIRAISLYNDIIAEETAENASEDLKEASAAIKQYCGKSLDMVEGLIDYSKNMTKKLQLQRVDLKIIINDCLKELRVLNSGLDIRVEIDDMPTVIGDKFLLKHAVYNILSNSIKYSSTREYVNIIIRYRSNIDFHIISFEDNGVGFDMSGGADAFNIFTRMHTDDEFAGVGIGLTLVKNIINKHNGDVNINTAINQGCAITITLPR